MVWFSSRNKNIKKQRNESEGLLDVFNKKYEERKNEILKYVFHVEMIWEK